MDGSWSVRSSQQIAQVVELDDSVSEGGICIVRRDIDDGICQEGRGCSLDLQQCGSGLDEAGDELELQTLACREER